jgi:transcriptional regulator with XRE-family HTH domain
MDNELAITLGNAARQARKALGLTQERVAEQLGVSVEFYSRIERGRALPSTETFERMVSVLDVSADTLFGLPTVRPAAPATYALPAGDDPPEVRRLVAALPGARASTLRVISALLSEFERVSETHRRPRKRGHKPPPGSGDT